jgi:hypothetical protein
MPRWSIRWRRQGPEPMRGGTREGKGAVVPPLPAERMRPPLPPAGEVERRAKRGPGEGVLLLQCGRNTLTRRAGARVASPAGGRGEKVVGDGLEPPPRRSGAASPDWRSDGCGLAAAPRLNNRGLGPMAPACHAARDPGRRPCSGQISPNRLYELDFRHDRSLTLRAAFRSDGSAPPKGAKGQRFIASGWLLSLSAEPSGEIRYFASAAFSRAT